MVVVEGVRAHEVLTAPGISPKARSCAWTEEESGTQGDALDPRRREPGILAHASPEGCEHAVAFIRQSLPPGEPCGVAATPPTLGWRSATASTGLRGGLPLFDRSSWLRHAMTHKAATTLKAVRYLPIATVLLAFAPHGAGRSPQPPSDAADAWVAMQAYAAQWRDLIERKEAIGDEAFAQHLHVILNDALDWDALTSAVLPGAGAALRPRERADFVHALEVSFGRRLLSYFEELGGTPSLKLKSVDDHGAAVTIQCSVETRFEKRDVTVHMVRTSQGVWRIRDVDVGPQSMTESYARYAAGVLDTYSFPYLVAQLSDASFVTLEDFEKSTVGKLPAGWKWKDQDNKTRKPYKVEQEGGNKYLAARDEGQSVIIAKDVNWNLEEYPYVSFRWRVHEVPQGADERFHDKVDSAAGVYFVYRKVLGLIPESVKYVWSSTLPVGSAMQRSGVGKPWMVVAETGTDSLGVWRTYVFNLAEAYKATFGGWPPKEAIGIGILSDANSMKARAYADYDDIRALRSADSTVGSGVRQILQAQ